MTMTLTADNAQALDAPVQKGFLSRAFHKAADIAGRAAVTQGVKIAAAAALTAAGASAFVSLAGAAVATGVGAAIYTYGRDSWQDYRQAQRDGLSFKWWDAPRAKKAAFALACGVAGGAFGAWLAGTETFQTVMQAVISYAGVALGYAGSFIGGMLGGTAHAATLPAAALEDMTRMAAATGAGADTAAATADTVTAGADTAAVAAAAAAEVSPADSNVLARLVSTVSQYDAAQGPARAAIARINPANIDKVSPQFLKDRAHDVLRMRGIPVAERFGLARALAEEAKERGNRQAAGFLRDLGRLEARAGITPVQAPAASAALPAGKDPIGDIIRSLPADDAVTQAPAPAVTPEPAADPLKDLPLQVITDPVTPAFSEAARCTVTLSDAGVQTGISCDIMKDMMEAGDEITFVQAGNASVTVTTRLMADSVSVPTDKFMHERVIADGVSRLNQVRVNVTLR